MKNSLMALSLTAMLSFMLTAPCSAEETATKTTTSVEGVVHVTKDSSGKVSIVSVKTDQGNLLVPTKSMENFVGYDRKKVKVCCSVSGKIVVPICVTGIVQAQKIPSGKVH